MRLVPSVRQQPDVLTADCWIDPRTARSALKVLESAASSVAGSADWPSPVHELAGRVSGLLGPADEVRRLPLGVSAMGALRVSRTTIAIRGTHGPAERRYRAEVLGPKDKGLCPPTRVQSPPIQYPQTACHRRLGLPATGAGLTSPVPCRALPWAIASATLDELSHH